VARNFNLLGNVQTRSKTHPVSCSADIGSSFPVGRVSGA